MDMWGNKMQQAVFVLAEMAAEGFAMPADAFTSRMMYGPHLLAPTGSDFNKFGNKGTVLAGYHYDLNFLTIHGKSRFPGLNVWTREGRRMGVAIPDGCLLVQAGRQIEYLTGGHVLAGYHEVVVNEQTVNAISAKKAKGQSLWRVSSTLFAHIQSDQILEPLAPFSTKESAQRFPPKHAGEQVTEELQAINLDQSPGRR
jgi:isopenicillin N synthase-like dioxygenase